MPAARQPQAAQVALVETDTLAALVDEVRALRRELATMRNPEPDWLPISAYAQKVGRSPETVRRWIAEGRVEAEYRGNVRGVSLNPTGAQYPPRSPGNKCSSGSTGRGGR